MLAKNDAPSLVVIAFIVIAVIIGRVVEYFKKLKADQEAKERKLRSSQAEGRDSGTSVREAQAGPAAGGGLQSLLDALEGRDHRPDAPPAEEPSEERGEVWEFDDHSVRTGERFMDPAISAHECAIEPAPSAHTPVIAAAPPDPYEQQMEAEAKARRLSKGSASPPPALAAAGLFAGPGGPPLRDQARRGILWSVVLGPPRATVPYGERGAAEAPGGIV